MSSVVIDPWIHERIQWDYHCRNGELVDATYQMKLAALVNQLMRLRPKEVCSFEADLSPALTSFAFESRISPFAAALVVRAYVAKSDGTYSDGFGQGSYLRVSINNSADTIRLADSVLYGGGAIGESPSDVPDEFSIHTLFMDAAPLRSKTIHGYIFNPFTGSGVGLGNYTGRLLAVTVYEQPLPPDTIYGYLAQQYHIGQNILDSDRQGVAEAAAMLWKFGMGPLFNFSSMSASSAPSNATTTWKNIIDDTTTPSSDSPGFWVDQRACNTKSRSGVPVVFAAYLATSTGVGSGGVRIVDQGGTVLATLSGSPGIGTWFQTTLTLPPTQAKYDVQYQGDATNALRPYAVNVYAFAA